MNLIKVSFYNGVSVIIKMLTMLGLNKVLAVYVGPGGYAIIGQFQSFVQTLATFSAGSIANGITKYTAQNANEEKELIVVWKTAGTVSIVSSLFVSIIILIFFKDINAVFFHGKIDNNLSFWLAGSFVFMMLNSYLMAILNGMKAIKAYVFLNISSSLLVLVVTGFFAFTMGLKGALIALTLNQSLNFIITFSYFIKQKWFKVRFLVGNLNKAIVKGLGRFAFMALFSSLAVPFTQMFLRSYIGANISWDVSGYWEAINRISTINIMLATTTLTLYYLPKLSETNEKRGYKHELISISKLLVPVTAVGCFCVFYLKDYIVNILFTPSFINMSPLFGWQMVGDFFKVLSWMFSFALLTKEKWKAFIVCEILSAIVLIMSTIIIVHSMSWHYLSLAYAVTYFIYLLLTSVFFYQSIYKKAF
ncbi:MULTISPECIES: O-antigen translocase [Enterobacter]|jgi:PST family polysaccharide transporter|uniref:O-antigen translocase n=1 Tax=Enterobacter TaxID=547 RepID=UPI000665B77C|nr:MULTISPECIES: O-antigen translocase [Enterobacter]MBS6013949.1 O-antigen translocase [Enterobacter cloacae]AUM04367.1 O-antigen translocase [Enterobacter sp. Crenshaw]ELC7378433.1 O-antigen translocase [Enterobacter asburiae]MBT1731086.1 O-antigen translocase [Enterobacter asburiae]MCK7142705.1 O-antigen translocase [Enterobacter asburiae]